MHDLLTEADRSSNRRVSRQAILAVIGFRNG
jgi:hypothetical protein